MRRARDSGKQEREERESDSKRATGFKGGEIIQKHRDGIAARVL